VNAQGLMSKLVEPASGNSGKVKGGKRRKFDKNRKRGFHHGTYDAEYMTALSDSQTVRK